MQLQKVQNTVNELNAYIAKQTVLEFHIRKYDGWKLQVVGSFDLCYYHDIEVFFRGVSYMAVQDRWSDLTYQKCPFSVSQDERLQRDNLIQITVCNDDGEKQIIICEDFDFIVKHVSYYDEDGKFVHRRD